MSLIGKSWEFMSELGKRTPWGEINLQPLVDNIANVAPEFVRFLQNGGRLVVSKHFPTWRVVKLGLNKTPEAYVASIEGRGRKFDSWALDIAAKVACSLEQIELPLVDVLDTDLGITGVYTTQEFYERAATFGLYPCPAEAGLALADQFDDQPKNDYRHIAMEAIAASDGGLGVFCIHHAGDGLRLEASDGHPEAQWDPGDRWVLTTRKP